MSKMSDDWKNKSMLRCYAEGGLVAGARQRTLDKVDAQTMAKPVNVSAPAVPESTEQEKAKSVGISIPAYVPPPKQEAPSMFSRLRKAIGMADGGSPWDSSYAPGGSLSMRAKPAPVQNILQRQVAAPVAPMAAPMAAPTAAAPSVLAPQSPATPTGPTHSIATANVSFSNSGQGTVGDWAGSPKLSASGYPMGLRSGGRVSGPGGPREDKIPAMLSDGEYVLPAKTVDAMGGTEQLDQVVKATNDGREPGPKGLRMAGGGTALVPWDPVSGNPVQPYGGVPRSRALGLPVAGSEYANAAAAAPQPAAPKAPLPTSTGLRGKIAGGLVKGDLAIAPVIGAFNTFSDTPEHVAQTAQSVTPAGEDPNSGVNKFRGGVARFLQNTGNAATFGLAGKVGDALAGALAPHQGPAATPMAAASSPMTVKGDAAMQGPPNVMAATQPPETGGSILRRGNQFVGAQGGERGQQLQDIETQRAQQRYQNDAQGMYASIQGHIANGDLETANKLAWDSTSRALVSQGFAARNAGRGVQGNGEEDAVNARYDKQADGLRKIFRSDKAQGNLAKHLDALSGTRAAELANLRNTQTQTRGQNMLSENNAAKIASEQAIAGQRNKFEATKMAQEQSNKDREFKLNVSKYGTEVAGMLHKQGEERDAKNQGHIDRFSKEQFVDKDGKPDAGTSARFSEFVHGAYGDFGDLSSGDRNSMLAEALTKFRIKDAADKKQGFVGGKSTTQFRPTGTPRPSTTSDLGHGLPLTTYLGTKVPYGNTDVVDIPGVGVRGARDLGADDSTDVSDYLYRGLRNRGKQ